MAPGLSAQNVAIVFCSSVRLRPTSRTWRAAAANSDAESVENSGCPSGGQAVPSTITIGRSWPQHGCAGLGANAGGVGFHAPATAAGT